MADIRSEGDLNRLTLAEFVEHLRSPDTKTVLDDERAADEIERLQAFVQEIAGQVCNYGNGLQNDECYEKSGRRCQPCQARHLLHGS